MRTLQSLWGVMVCGAIFLGLNILAHRKINPSIDFWSFLAAPVGAAVTWFLFMVVLYFAFPPNTDPSKHDYGILPLLGFIAILVIPIYIACALLGAYWETTGWGLLGRFGFGAVLCLIPVAVVSVGVYVITRY